jgi:hypothetical protein
MTTANVSPDPVFALIEEHRIAYIAHGAVRAAADSTEAQLEAASETDIEARDSLTNIAPSTVAGCAALLRYVADHVAVHEQGDPDGWPDIYQLIRNVADALERLA